MTNGDSAGSDLHQLLSNVRECSGAAFNDIERCFESGVAPCEEVTGRPRGTADIFEEFQASFSQELDLASKQENVKDDDRVGGGSLIVALEVMRALIDILLHVQPKDVHTRLEEELR